MTGELPEQLGTLLRDAARTWDRNRARSKQTAIGASDLGHPCDRYLAFKAISATEVNERDDSWLATIGTAVHTMLEDALSGPGFGTGHGGRWLTETRLEIAPGVYGTGDLFDTVTGTAIDHKILGTESLRNLRLRGAKPQYRAQLHLCGLGYRNLGYDVHHVAIAGWPRSSFLNGTNGLHIWTEPYDEEIAEQALQRWFRIVEAAPDLSQQPFLMTVLPTADGPCNWCPYRNAALAAQNPGAACAGDPSLADAATKRATAGLIA